MHVICINDKDFLPEIPLNKRVKEGEKYTVIEATILKGHGGILGYKLEEIDLSSCAPYLYFAASRFVPISEPPVEKLEEVLEEVF